MTDHTGLGNLPQ